MDIINEIVRLSKGVNSTTTRDFALIKCYSDSEKKQLIGEFGSYVDAKKFLKANSKFNGRKSDNIGQRIDIASERGTAAWDIYWTCKRINEGQKEQVKQKLKEKETGVGMMEQLRNFIIQELNNPLVRKLIECEEVYFQKAIDKYNEFISFKKLGEEKTIELVEKINQLKNKNSFSHSNLLNDYNENSQEHKILFLIGELVAYLDSHANGKKKYNKYEDKRTIAKAGVRQYAWDTNLLKYKETMNLNDVSFSIGKALMYVMNPGKQLPVLSEAHRKLIQINLFNGNVVKNLEELVYEEFNKCNIIIKNEANRGYLYAVLLYSKEIYKIWNFSMPIWKISHGTDVEFINNIKGELLQQNKVIVNRQTKRSGGKNFIENIKVGHLFYLCFGSEIKLLGKITSDATTYEGTDWMVRSYEIIKPTSNMSRYRGTSKGWSPNYNSTCVMVPQDSLKTFENELLLPYFDMNIDELMNLEEIDTTINKVGFVDKQMEETNIESVYQDLNYILYGPPGTGKTYNTINYAVAFIENKELEEVQNEDYSEVRNRYNEYLNNNQIAFTTFHQSYGYEDFIEGIKPNLENEKLNYKLENGIFKLLCTNAREDKNNKYVMIIDEINRGNVSKVFGELITLIEKSKRDGNDETITSKLPYSKKDFSVPSNVFILGTMNTADRSIALLDTALRRRFKFIEMLPDENVIRKLNNNVDLEIEDININKVLTYINKRIEILYDRDHTIGHSFFMDLTVDGTIENLETIFIGRIIPLLQEYFHDDYEKIRLVLADNQTKDRAKQFINAVEVEQNLFGNVYDLDDYSDTRTYEINIEAFSNPEAYIKIYSGM